MIKRRSEEATKAYLDGFNYGIEQAAKRLETANDETSRICIIQAIRDLKQHTEHLLTR